MIHIQCSQQLGDFHLSAEMELGGGVTAIFGRSGAGKTSLIHLLAGLSKPDKGQIFINGCCCFDGEKGVFVPPEKRRLGVVFQDARLFPHYRVKGNLLYGRRKKQSAKAKESNVLFDEVTELLGISHLLDRFPHHLSGGEKQRVAIARALLTEPEMLLLDEPMASLDELRKQELMPWLMRLVQESQIPVVLVTHQLAEVLQLASNLVLLEQGKVIVSGSLESVWNSALMRPWLREKDGLGNESVSTVWQARVAELQHDMTKLLIDADTCLWADNADLVQGESVRLTIRAADVSVTRLRPEAISIRNILPVTLKHSRSIGHRVELELVAGAHTFVAHITPWASEELQLQPGEPLFALIKALSLTPAHLLIRNSG